MNFNIPHEHRAVYLLGACGILVIALALVIKKELSYHASSSQTPVVVTKGGASSTAPFIPPIASSSHPLASTTSTTVTKPPVPVPPSPLDKVSADAYIVGNAATGAIYLSKNPTMVNGLASISKLFTALVADDNMDQSQVIQITPAMLAVYPNAYGILLGEKFSLNDLIYAMLLQSNDNIAEGIAMAYSSPTTYISAPAGTAPSEAAFIDKMNALSGSLGLTQTHFEDASGLADGNVSNARDLFSFARYLYRSQPALLTLSATYAHSVATTTDHLGHTFININPFAGQADYIGGKTGRTDTAGETMLSIFDYKFKGVDYPIVVIVLHSDILERQSDTELLYQEALKLIGKNES